MASLWKMKWICTAIRTDFYTGQGIYFSALLFFLVIANNSHYQKRKDVRNIFNFLHQ